MKTLILFDSKFGNTKKIAEAMGEALSKKNEVKVVHVAEATNITLEDYEFVIIGFPINGGWPSPIAKTYIDSISAVSLVNKKVAVFDTGSTPDGEGFVGRTAIKLFGHAAPRVAKILERKAATNVVFETFFVKGYEGPIVAGEIERAQAWVLSLL